MSVNLIAERTSIGLPGPKAEKPDASARPREPEASQGAVEGKRKIGGRQKAMSSAKLQSALVTHAPELRSFLGGKIPPKLRSFIVEEDVLNEIFLAAFRAIDTAPKGPRSEIERWLKVIAQRQLINAIKNAQCAKRGGHAVTVRERTDRLSSIIGLWESVRSPDKTPSSAAAAAEAVDEMQIALASLPEFRRRAIALRFFEGRSYDEIARLMQKSTTAVRGLLFHGLRQLRDNLGSASRFLSDGGHRSPAESRLNED